MPGRIQIHVDVDAAEQYRFRLRSGRREVTTTVNPDLAASFYEDLRLLRWKSAGIHDQGDILLSHVGDRLATFIAPPARWEELELPNEARDVRIRFSKEAHRLMSFPWELLRVNDQFLIGTHGSHLKREVPAPAPRRRRRNPVVNVVYVSLAPEFMLLGERWFPNWRTDHRAGFRRLCAAFFTLAAHDNFDVEMGSRLLDWAVRLEDWTTAVMICVAVSRWYTEHGRLEDMKATFDLLLPHATGMERIILRGHLATITFTPLLRSKSTASLNLTGSMRQSSVGRTPTTTSRVCPRMRHGHWNIYWRAISRIDYAGTTPAWPSPSS